MKGLIIMSTVSSNHPHEIENTAQTGANTTEATTATYVDAARQGKNEWWRYLLGLVVILFSWLIVGTAASVGVAFALSGQTNYAALSLVGQFLYIMTGFPFFLVGILIAVSRIHRRHPRTLVTARKRIDWGRVGQGFVAWFIPVSLVSGPGQYLLYPDTFSFTADLATFALFVPLALVLTAVQTTTEELFFRGYLVQGASRIWTNRVFLALMSAVLFTLPHLGNPEAQAGGWLQIVLGYFASGGLVWVIVSLIDGTTELAIGAHFANNISFFLLVNAAGGPATTPALFMVSAYHATFYTLSVLVIVPVFLAIAYGVFRRKAPTRAPAQPEVSSATPVEY
jgi:uncharacterized protein